MEHFMELYQTVYADLYRLAYYYMGNAQDAEDAVQDAALAACEHFDRLKRKPPFVHGSSASWSTAAGQF